MGLPLQKKEQQTACKTIRHSASLTSQLPNFTKVLYSITANTFTHGDTTTYSEH